MGKKLFVGNLPFSATEQELTDLFGQHGTVESAKIIVDKMSGRSKGFAFVELATDDQANQAISAMNGVELGGRSLSVSEARPMEPRAPRSFDGPRGGGGGGGGRRDRDSRGGGGGGGGGWRR